ncbi:MAG TPA: response regulator [Cyclobacteriaceae bacterium]|nr:response regulator [Cyclobacteriaceae bacterium]
MTTEVEILLVEDTRSDAEMTIRAIRKANISNNIVHLKDGQEALDFLFGNGEYEGRNTNMKPKVIMLDLKMPKVDGLELLERLKNDLSTKNIPVVVLTSSKENPDIDKCYQLGVNSYIVKPVASIDFMETVANLGLYWVLHNQVPDK